VDASWPRVWQSMVSILKQASPSGSQYWREALLQGRSSSSPGYGIPFRRNLFTSVAHDSRENTRYTMASGFTQDEVDRGIRQRYVNTRRGDASAIGGGSLHWNCNTQVPFDLFQDVHPQGYFDRLQINFRVQRLAASPDALARGRTAPEFGREHKEFMRQIYNLQGPDNATRAAQLRRGGFGVAVVRPTESWV